MMEKKPQEDTPTFEPEGENYSLFQSFKYYVWEIIKVVVVSLAIIIPVRYYLIQPFYVKGASMEPSFHDHEYLIIDEISYRFDLPARGDIVVFKYPKDPSQFFIKRVIGLPGECIKISAGKIKITAVGATEEFVLEETEYLLKGIQTQGEIDIQLKSDEFYVLGDNRGSSLDSRSFGPIHLSDIIGRTWVRGWPFDKIKVFKSPNYN